MKLRFACVLLSGLAAVRLLAADPAASKNVRIDLDAPVQPPVTKPAAAPKTAAPAKAREATTVTGTISTTPGKAAPAKPAKPAKKTDEAKKTEASPKIDGLAVSRGAAGFLGIKVESNTWKISFYDREKKPIAADVAHIALRWPVQYQPNPERALLSPTGDGKVMTSDKTVRPPFTFTLYVTLLKDATATDQPAETYVVEFHQ